MSESADRRAVERIAVTSGTSCSFISPVVEDFGAARIRDISLNGIGLVVARKLEVGTLLVIELVNQDHGFSRTMMVRVAHVTVVNGGFLIGGEFTTPLTYQEFTTFVMCPFPFAVIEFVPDIPVLITTPPLAPGKAL